MRPLPIPAGIEPLAVSFNRLLTFPESLAGRPWLPGNCSIARSDDGYLVAIRLMNYRLGRGGWPVGFGPRGDSESRMLLVTLDRDLNQTGVRELDTSLLDEIACRPRSVRNSAYGLEDPRLFRWRGAWWIVANTVSLNPWGYPGVALGRIDAELSRVEHLVSLEYPRRLRDEKNWLPFVRDDRLLLLYSTVPTVVLEADPQTGDCREFSRRAWTTDLRELRGSTPLLPREGRAGYLYATHEYGQAGNQRTYWQRFAELDAALSVSRISAPFCFRELAVEYSCGQCLSHDNQTLLISWSFNDGECLIAGLPLAHVDAMLRPVDAATRR